MQHWEAAWVREGAGGSSSGGGVSGCRHEGSPLRATAIALRGEGLLPIHTRTSETQLCRWAKSGAQVVCGAPRAETLPWPPTAIGQLASLPTGDTLALWTQFSLCGEVRTSVLVAHVLLRACAVERQGRAIVRVLGLLASNQVLSNRCF